METKLVHAKYEVSLEDRKIYSISFGYDTKNNVYFSVWTIKDPETYTEARRVSRWQNLDDAIKWCNAHPVPKYEDPFKDME